jgi:hypothetical protein
LDLLHGIIVLSLFESVKVTASKNFGIDFGSSNLLHYFFHHEHCHREAAFQR